MLRKRFKHAVDTKIQDLFSNQYHCNCKICEQGVIYHPSSVFPDTLQLSTVLAQSLYFDCAPSWWDNQSKMCVIYQTLFFTERFPPLPGFFQERGQWT